MVGTELIVPRLVSTIDRCPYVEEIWKHLLNTLLARGSPLPLQDEAEWVMNHYPGHGLISSIAKLAFSATIYHTWKEPGFSSNLIKPQGSFFTRFAQKSKVGFPLPS